MFEVFHVTVHGAGHIKSGQPCEDYSISAENETCRIFVVADGHGDSNCPRSRLGSEYICRIALEDLTSFEASVREQGWACKLLRGREQEPMLRQLITSIFGKWKMAVCGEFRQNPLSEEERAGCSKYISLYDRGERIEHIYGTTMIAGLLTEEYLLLLQQGDGRCDVFDKTGEVTQPIPWDERCFSNVTTSLCDTDAIASCRYCVMDMKETPVAAVMAGSDGVEDSFFSMDLMHSYYRDLLTYAAKNSVESLRQHLEETLPEFSRTGSGDDTSIAGFIDPQALSDYLLLRFEMNNENVRVESRLTQLNDRIKSMESGKMQYLEKRCAKAYEEFDRASRAISGLFKGTSNDADAAAYEEKKQKFEAAVRERDEYAARYQRLKKEREELTERLNWLRAPLPDLDDEWASVGDETGNGSEEAEKPQETEEPSEAETFSEPEEPLSSEATAEAEASPKMGETAEPEEPLVSEEAAETEASPKMGETAEPEEPRVSEEAAGAEGSPEMGETAEPEEPRVSEEASWPQAKEMTFPGNGMTGWASSFSNKATGVVKKLFGKEED